ncbi:hypothetical protein WJX74_004433 [Apatococcus lobatus]
MSPPGAVPEATPLRSDVPQAQAGMQPLLGSASLKAAEISDADPSAHAEPRGPVPWLGVGGGSTASPADLYSLYSFLAAADIPTQVVPCPALGCLLMLADLSEPMDPAQVQAGSVPAAPSGPERGPLQPAVLGIVLDSVAAQEPAMSSPDALPEASSHQQDMPLSSPAVCVPADLPSISQPAALGSKRHEAAGNPGPERRLQSQVLPEIASRLSAFQYTSTTGIAPPGMVEGSVEVSREPSEGAQPADDSPMEVHMQAAVPGPASKSSPLPSSMTVQPPSQLILPISTAFEGLTPSLLLHACSCVLAMGCEFLTLAIIDGDGTLSMTRVYPGLHAPDAGNEEEPDPEAGPAVPDD